MTYNRKYYFDEPFRTMSNKWWRSLSTAQMKAFEEKYHVFHCPALLHDVAKIYDLEGCPMPEEGIPCQKL